MIVESILIIVFALSLDLLFGDPKNRYHPTAWMGMLIGKIVSFTKSHDINERLAGIVLVSSVSFIVISFLVLYEYGLQLISFEIISAVITISVGSVLLKTTIAIRGMEKHALVVVDSIAHDNIQTARDNLAMIVKRNTSNLDKNHILSGVLESVSENTVDGITGPLFYYGLFGLPGAFAYRAINTIDSMIGYKTNIFKNLGWFGAKCDTVLNYLPARLTGLVMILSSMLLGYHWRSSFHIMMRDGKTLDSVNAGYPMAALAGAIDVKLEKIDHYQIGDGSSDIIKQHVTNSILLMKVTTMMFFGVIVIPIILVLSYLGWWIHA